MAAPVFDRQRIILDLLHQSRARPSHLQLMKWLFLLGQETEVRDALPYYDFLPYRYGPFSFTVYAELRRLKDRGLVTETLEIPNGQRRAVDAQVERLKRKAHDATLSIVARYGDTKPRALLGDVYQRYEWFTSRSSLRSHEATPVAEAAVYTAGYEGDSIDAFLNKLLEARMRRVIDVRKNAYSHKFGFSGGPLRKFCSKVGLDYQHVPELGIPSRLRSDLSTTGKRQKLFARYKKEILPAEQEAQQRAIELLSERPSALLCMERHHEDCHRGTLAAALAPRAKLSIVHLS